MTAAASTAEEAYVERLAPATRAALAAALGLGKGRIQPGALADALRDPVAVGRAHAALSTDARVLLRALHTWPRLPHVPVAPEWRSIAGWTTERTATALDALTAVGFVVTAPRRPLELAPPFDDPHGTTGLEDYCRSIVGDPPRPAGFTLAVIWTLIREQAPRYTQQRRAHARWVERTAEFLSTSTARVHEHVWLLTATHAVVVHDPFGPARLLADPVGAQVLFGVAPADLALVTVASREIGEYAQSALARAMHEAPGESSFPYAALVRAAEVLCEEGRIDRRLHLPALGAGLADLWAAGLVVPEDGGRRWRSVPSAPPTGRWVVQPNLDVLVPVDVPPAAVAELGTFANVLRLDGVSIFRLTKESVGEAAALGYDGARCLGILTAHAAAPVPENVVAMIRGWAGTAPPLRHWVGAVIVANDAAQAAFLRGSDGVSGEIAPNVFTLAKEAVQRVLGAASRAGIPVDPRDMECSALPRMDLVEKAAAIRETIAARAVPLPKRKSEPARRGAVAATRRDADPVRLSTALPALVDRLGRRHPRLARFALQHPEYAEWLLALPPRYRRMLEGMSPDRLLAMLRDIVRTPRSAEDDEGLFEDVGVDEDEDEADDDEAVDEDQVRVEVEAGGAHGDRAVRGTWATPAPGALRALVMGAIARGVSIEILYASAKGDRATHEVVPLTLAQRAGHDWLDATVLPRGFRSAFRLDRIAAVRAS
jgi:hypothetical protein